MQNVRFISKRLLPSRIACSADNWAGSFMLQGDFAGKVLLELGGEDEKST
jgi:hypothetical protein